MEFLLFNININALSAQTATFTGTIQNNTALGFNTLTSIINGSSNNTAIGANSMQANTSGVSNTAIDYSSLAQNTTGQNNTAVGSLSLSKNTTGIANVSIGLNSLSSNVSIGTSSLLSNTTGNQNVSVETGALEDQTTGINNIAIGFQAGVGSDTTLACITGQNYTFIGVETGFQAAQQSNSTAIGYGSTINGDHQDVLGTVYETVICPNNLNVNGTATIVNGFTLGSATVKVEPSLNVVTTPQTPTTPNPTGYFTVNINGTPYGIAFY